MSEYHPSQRSEMTLEDMTIDERYKYLQRHLEGQIAPVPVRFFYRLRVLAVAVVMILLPLIYVAMIAAATLGVLYHLENHTANVEETDGFGRLLLSYFSYLAPAIGGGILILFMLKPFVSPPARKHRPRMLKRAAEPLLFAFVNRICDVVGSPRPNDIAVNSEVNASAGLRNGIWSIFRKDVMLTLGLPLMAGMTLREFSGILAHEFGHFAQSAGVWQKYVIRTVNNWFTRAVYERDVWDRRLEHWSQTIDLRLAWMFYLVRFGVWTARRILWCLMLAGRGVSSSLLRQMEHDADRYEALLAGSQSFENASRRREVLGAAYRHSIDDLRDYYQEGRLVDNLPQLVVSTAEMFSSEFLRKIRNAQDSQQTHRLATHPSDRERIARTRAENAEGIFQVDAAASVLSLNFQRLCRACSIQFYREVLGKKFNKEDLRSWGEMSQFQPGEDALKNALLRVFRGGYSDLRNWEFDFETFDDDETSLDVLRECVQELQSVIDAAATEYCSRIERLTKCDSRLVQCFQAEAFRRADMPFVRDTFDDDLREEKETIQIKQACEDERLEILESVSVFESSMREMLSVLGMALQHRDYPGETARASQLTTELLRLNESLQIVNAESAAIDTMRFSFAAMELLLQALQTAEDHEPLLNTLDEERQVVHDQMDDLTHRFHRVSYPFDHASREITLGDFLLEESPEPDDLAEVYLSAQVFIDRIVRLRIRLLGRICIILDEVRETLGISPFDEPAASKKTVSA